MALILGGLRNVWGGRKGGSIYSAIKMNMVQELTIYLEEPVAKDVYFPACFTIWVFKKNFLITFFIEITTENASTYKSKTK